LKNPLLLGCRGCGSAIVRFGYALAGLPLDYEEIDYSPGSATRERLLAVNPLGQVPALVMPDGRVLTESLAILHLLDDAAPKAGLIPPKGDATRAAFHRWAVFLVAAVYPTFTYGDDAGKWVGGDEAAAKALRASTDAQRQALLGQLEEACGAPHFLGERFSAIDLYLAAMCAWRPGKKWWQANAPRLFAAATKARERPELKAIVAKEFG
jgi:GST-like protein